MVEIFSCLCLSSLMLGCIPRNIFLSVRPHAEHVRQVSAHLLNCLDLGQIRLLDFPEYEDAAYNRDHFIKYATNITGKRGGDTFRVVKRYKTYYAPEGYPPEPYLNGIAEAYRCHKKEGFILDEKFTVDLRYTEPQKLPVCRGKVRNSH